jgi:hypothetical protein
MGLSSLDTNILLYASNEDAPEHGVCKAFLEQVVENPSDWIIADQVFLELYRALRNPKVMSRPLPSRGAVQHLSILRDEMGIMHCGYSPECWGGLMRQLERDDFPARRTHDAVLAGTLAQPWRQNLLHEEYKGFCGCGISETDQPG